MIFLGYWSLWFLLGFILAMFRLVRFTMGNNRNGLSFLSLLVFSFFLAVPSTIAHYAFLRIGL